LGGGEIVSPADGRVIFLQEVFDDRFLKGETVKVSIFMSLFNVHINRIPIGGRVEKIIYNKGKFFSANLDKASIENEFNGVILNIEDNAGDKNKRIAFVQIAGLIARRIVCNIKEGDRVRSGNRFGLIKFGSRLDLYLPLSFKQNIKVGDIVFSGKTIIGKIS
jgi:phosphatidylserine decarboxylase